MPNKAEFLLTAKDMSGPAFNSITRNLKQMERQAQETEVAVGGFELSARNIGLTLAAGSAAIAAAVPQLAAYGREIQLQAQMADMGATEFQSWAYAVDTVGIRMDKLADISKEVKNKIGDFLATGGGEFADFFEKVAPAAGVTAEQLAELSGPDALLAVKQAMDEVNVSASEQTFYFESIANDASLLIPLLAGNGTELRKLRQEFDQLDLALTEEELGRLNTMAGDMSRIWTAMKNTAAAATSSQSDSMHAFSDAVVGSFGAATQSFRQWQDLLDEDTTAGKLWDVFANGLIGSKVLEEYGQMVGLDAKETGTFAAAEFAKGWKQALAPGFDIPKPDAAPDVETPNRPASDVPVFDIEIMTKEDWERQQKAIEELDRLMAQAAVTGLDATQRLVVGYDRQMKKLDDLGAKHPELADQVKRSRDLVTQNYYAALDKEAAKRESAQSRELASYVRTYGSEEQALAQSLRDRTDAIEEQEAKGVISFEQAQRDKLRAAKQFTDDYNDLVKERIEEEGSALERLQLHLAESTEFQGELFEDMASRLSDGMGQAFERAIFDSENLGDAVGGIFEGMGRSMVAFFGEWAAQRMMQWVLEKTIGAADGASYITSVGGRGAAETQLGALNAASATAAIPIIGPLLAPGAALAFEAFGAGMTTAAVGAASSAFAGAFDSGGYIPWGKWGIVAEKDTELVDGVPIAGPAHVTSREQTNRILNQTTTQGGTTTFNIYGANDAQAVGREVGRQLRRRNKRRDTALSKANDRGRRNRGLR